MSFVRACVLSVALVPTLALAAADNQTYPGTTKPNPPPRVSSGSMLVDKTIPAYGVQGQVPHYTESRANTLYLEIHQVLADVESQVMSGAIGRSAVQVQDKASSTAPQSNLKMIGDARINELRNRLEVLDARIIYRTYLEQWHIDNSFSDLSRATELLAMTGDVSQATVDKVHSTKQKDPAAEAPSPKAPEAPVTEAPVTEAPVTEAPVAVPKAPAVVAPVTVPEVPTPDAPAEELPSVDAPGEELPAADAPAEELPSVDAPGEELPPTEAPAEEEPTTEETPTVGEDAEDASAELPTIEAPPEE